MHDQMNGHASLDPHSPLLWDIQRRMGVLEGRIEVGREMTITAVQDVFSKTHHGHARTTRLDGRVTALEKRVSALEGRPTTNMAPPGLLGTITAALTAMVEIIPEIRKLLVMALLLAAGLGMIALPPAAEIGDALSKSSSKP